MPHPSTHVLDTSRGVPAAGLIVDLDIVEWRYLDPADAFSDGASVATARRIVFDVFQSFESGSIPQVIYQLGTSLLAGLPAIAEVQFEAQNLTWDAGAERGHGLGVYADPRPPYGCLGLRLKR